MDDVGGPTAPRRLARVDEVADLEAALDALEVPRPRTAMVLVGGAGTMDPADLDTVADLFAREVLPQLAARGAVVVDGGTDAGVMAAIGRARADSEYDVPLVGVAARGTVVDPDRPTAAPDGAVLEPHHTRVVLVPGSRWGDESPWLAAVADAVARDAPSLTLLVNGGQITYADARESLERGRPVVVLAGTGRTADAIAAAKGGGTADERATRIAASALTIVSPVEAVADGLREAWALSSDGRAGRSVR